jgi:hypothetical protein
MSRQAMENAISEVPGTALTRSNLHLLEVGDQLQDDILGILTTAQNVDLVVTPSRIISVGRNGSIEAWRYADVRQILFGGGKKKLFGGHGISFLHVYLVNGSTENFQLYGEYDHLYRVGMLAKSACQKAQIANL